MPRNHVRLLGEVFVIGAAKIVVNRDRVLKGGFGATCDVLRVPDMTPVGEAIPAAVIAPGSHPTADVAQAVAEDEDHVIFLGVGSAEDWSHDFAVGVPMDDPRIAEGCVAVEVRTE